MAIREVLGLGKKKEKEEETDALTPVGNGYVSPPEEFKLEPTESTPPGVGFEIGEELTPPPSFRINKDEPLLVRVTGAGFVKEQRRTKRTMRSFHLPVKKLVVHDGKVVSCIDGELVAHPCLGPIIEGRPLGECYSITCETGDARYRVHRVKLAEGD